MAGIARTIQLLKQYPHTTDEDGKRKAASWGWPGGYPMFYVANDGDTVCPHCVNNDMFHIGGNKDGWEIIGCSINWEDESMSCCNCNKPIPSAYGGHES